MFLTNVDYAVVVLLTIFFLGGWLKGFVRSMIGPFSFFLCFIGGIIYYDLTNNIFKSLFFVTLSTIVLSLLINLFFIFGRANIDPNLRNYVFWGSRVFGSVISVAWKGLITNIILLLIVLLPGSNPQLELLQKNIKESYSYAMFNHYVISQTPVAKNTLAVLIAFKDPAQRSQMSSLREYRLFFGDPRVKTIFNDPEIQEQLQSDDLTALIANPKILAIVRDDRLVDSLTRLARKIYAVKAMPEK